MARRVHSPKRRLRGSDRAAREHVESQGEVWDGEDFVKTEGFAEPPSFPALMLIMAVAKDVLDLPLDLSFVGIAVTTVLSSMVSVVLFFWFLGKMGGRWYKKALIKWLWKRILFTLAVELVPGLQAIPATTILVLMAYKKENKLVRIFNRSLELMHGKMAGKLPRS